VPWHVQLSEPLPANMSPTTSPSRDSLEASFAALNPNGVYGAAMGVDPNGSVSTTASIAMGSPASLSPARHSPAPWPSKRLWPRPRQMASSRPLAMMELSQLSAGVLNEYRAAQPQHEAAAVALESKTDRAMRVYTERLASKRANQQASRAEKSERFEVELEAQAHARQSRKLQGLQKHAELRAKRIARDEVEEAERSALLRRYVGGHAKGLCDAELSHARLDVARRAQHAELLEAGHSRRKTFVDAEVARTIENPGPGAHHIRDAKKAGAKIGDQKVPSQLDTVIMNAERLPGAADYSPATNTFGTKCGDTGTSVKFGDNISKTELDWVVHRAKQLPSPAEYTYDKPRTGNGGPRFSTAHIPNFVEQEISRTAMIPSSTDYTPKLAGRGGGQKISEGRPKSDLDLLELRYKYEPGPGEYSPSYVRQFSTSSSRAGAGSPVLGGRKSKTDLEWTIYHAKSLPGPTDGSIVGPGVLEGRRLSVAARYQAQRELTTMGSPKHPRAKRMSNIQQELSHSFERSISLPHQD
jgi:hypothetical protein